MRPWSKKDRSPSVVNWKPSEICQGPQRRSPKGSLGPWQIYRRVPISYSIEKVLQRLAGHLGKFTEGFPNLQKDSNFLLNRKGSLGPWQIYRRIPISYSIEKVCLQKDSNFLLNRKGLLWKYFSSFALWILQQVKQFEKKNYQE